MLLNAGELAGFREIRTLENSESLEIHVGFGRELKVCPKCDAKLHKHGHINKLCYDTNYHGRTRRFYIVFRRYLCASCGGYARQKIESLPSSVLALSSSKKPILVTRRLLDKISKSSDAENTLARKMELPRTVVRKIRNGNRQ